MESNKKKLINSTIIMFENNIQMQPMMVVKNNEGKEYLITISNDHRFIISEYFRYTRQYDN